MSSCVLKHLEFLSETGVFETENRMAERCRPGAKVRHDAAGVARACRGKENRERGRAETLPEEKAGLRGGKRGMRRAESACVGRKGVIIFCLLACLLAWRLSVSHFGRRRIRCIAPLFSDSDKDGPPVDCGAVVRNRAVRFYITSNTSMPSKSKPCFSVSPVSFASCRRLLRLAPSAFKIGQAS